MIWREVNCCDPQARRIADGHYNRQHPGSPRFSPPGRVFCLLSTDGLSVWVTSWPFAEYVKHRWAGAWVNSCFRRTGGAMKASEMIREAVAATRWKWSDVPALGMVSFIDADKVKHKRDPGRCYIRAGFKHAGKTEGGLIAVQMLPAEMPEPCAPLGTTVDLFEEGRPPCA